MKVWLKRAFQLLSLALFGLILSYGGAEPWRHILSGELRFILAALLLRGLAGMIASLRLRTVTSALSNQPPFSWRRLYYLTMTTRALGLIVPRSLSTIGGKSVALRAFGVSLKRAVWIVMADNLFDVLLLAALLPPSWFFLRGQMEAVGFMTAVLAVILLLALIIWWGMAEQRIAFLTKWTQKSPWIGPRLQQASASGRALFPAPPAALAALGLTILLNGVLAFSFYYIGRAVAVVTSATTYLAGFSFAQLSLIPAVTPGGLGIFDLGWLGMLRLGGITEADALTFVIAQRAFVYVF
ncbi:MAG: hypothetical protein GY803_06880, partial [Chloroflexi bacterium]|nr:hypothetical protein [Chloroflexota bacterium]